MKRRRDFAAQWLLLWFQEVGGVLGDAWRNYLAGIDARSQSGSDRIRRGGKHRSPARSPNHRPSNRPKIRVWITEQPRIQHPNDTRQKDGEWNKQRRRSVRYNAQPKKDRQ